MPPPPPEPTEYTVDLMGSPDLMAGMTTIPAGTSMKVGDTTLTCDGTEDCVLTVAEDSVTGGFSATSTGGTVTVAIAEPAPPPTPVAFDLPEGHELVASDEDEALVIEAGGTVTIGSTTVTCPDGGEDCTLYVSEQAATGNIVASYLGAMPTVTVTYAVGLPQKNTLVAGDEIEVEAGESVEMGGVSFTCPEDCVVTIAEGEDGNLVASSTGAEATAMQDPAAFRGYTAFSDLSDTIIDTAELTDLQTNLYHDEDDVMGEPGSPDTPAVEEEDNGGGVTSSVTTHEDPNGGDPNVTGVSDIAVTVETMAIPRGDDTKAIDAVQRDVRDSVMIIEVEINDPVMKDGSTAWFGDIAVEATWAANPAAGWDTGDLLAGGAVNMDDDPYDMWTAYFQHEQDLPGGRTLELDVKSDFVPGDAAFMDPILDDEAADDTNHYLGYPIVARGSAVEIVEATALGTCS